MNDILIGFKNELKKQFVELSYRLDIKINIKEFTRALQEHNTIESIVIKHCQIDDETIIILCQAFKKNTNFINIQFPFKNIQHLGIKK